MEDLVKQKEQKCCLVRSSCPEVDVVAAGSGWWAQPVPSVAPRPPKAFSNSFLALPQLPSQSECPPASIPKAGLSQKLAAFIPSSALLSAPQTPPWRCGATPPQHQHPQGHTVPASSPWAARSWRSGAGPICTPVPLQHSTSAMRAEALGRAQPTASPAAVPAKWGCSRSTSAGAGRGSVPSHLVSPGRGSALGFSSAAAIRRIV